MLGGGLAFPVQPIFRMETISYLGLIDKKFLRLLWTDRQPLSSFYTFGFDAVIALAKMVFSPLQDYYILIVNKVNACVGEDIPC